ESVRGRMLLVKIGDGEGLSIGAVSHCGRGPEEQSAFFSARTHQGRACASVRRAAVASQRPAGAGRGDAVALAGTAGGGGPGLPRRLGAAKSAVSLWAAAPGEKA